MKQNIIVEKLNNLFYINNNIKSTVLIGSFGRNNPKGNSDIDYQILITDDFCIDLFYKNIEQEFGDDLKHSLFLKEKNKWCFYLMDEYLVVEIFICNNLNQLNKYFLGSEIEEPKKAIVFDKSKTVELYLNSIIEEKNKLFDEIQKDNIEKLIVDFQNRFEACSNAHSKSDGYKFNVLYTHAVNCLVRIVYLCEGGIEHDYMPSNFLTEYSYKLNLKIESLGTMDMRFANSNKKNLLDLFLKYLPISIKKYNLKIDKEKIIRFLENIYERDFLWNFRDISKFNSKLKKGIIYRSSALCLYKKESRLEDILKSKSIETIVDLRADRELEEIFYDKKHQDAYKIIHAPFDPWNQSVAFQNTYNKGSNAEIAYKFFSIECKQSIRSVVLAVLNSKGGIDIHCHAGKDRTGIVISIFHLLSEAILDIVYLDYLASEMDTRKSYLKIFLNVVNENGGIIKYLKSCNLSIEKINELKSKICV